MKRGLSLVEWILLSVAALTLLALAVPAYARGRRHDLLVGCRDNLKLLYQAQAAAPKDPKALGMAYWTRLGVSPSTLRCPMTKGLNRTCDYLGPRAEPVDPADPLGCDVEDNHGEHGAMGGNVLYANGEVKTLHPREPGAQGDPWREAVRQKCGP